MLDHISKKKRTTSVDATVAIIKVLLQIGSTCDHRRSILPH